MSHRARKEKDTYDSELKDLEYKYYKRLKDGELKVKTSDSSYRCPFCDGKDDYSFREIIRHADRIGRGSRRKGLRETGQHLALSFYVGKYLRPKHDSHSASKSDSRAPLNDDKGKLGRPCKDAAASIPTEGKGGLGVTKGVSRIKDGSRSPSKAYLLPPLSSDQHNLVTPCLGVTESGSKTKPDHVTPKNGSVSCSAGQPDSSLPSDDGQRKFVWPCMGIVANIPTTVEGGRRVGESGSKMRDELTTKGYNPVRVQPIWNRHGHSGFSLVEFRKDWEGYKNALMFEKDFEVRGRGRADYYNRRRKDDLYGWFAGEDDYNSREIFSHHLRQKGDLRSVSDVSLENVRKDTSLFSYLQNALDVKHEHVKEMEEKYQDTVLSVKEVMEQKESMTSLYNEEIRKMQQTVRDDFTKILMERERAKKEVEAQKTELEQQEKHLLEREKHNEFELSQLKLKKEMNEKAIVEQKKAEAEALRLAQEHQREKENMRKKILELETQLDAKQAVELEIEQLRGALQVLGHMDEDNDPESHKQIEELKEKLEEKMEELEDTQELNQTLVIKYKNYEQELEDGRKEMIKGFLASGQAGRVNIGAKRTGEAKPAKVKRMQGNEEAELWHFKENREATLKEGIEYICTNWKRLK